MIPSRIDIITSIEGVAFDEAWPARMNVGMDDVELPVIGRDHLVRNKQAVSRPRDIADAARLLAQRLNRP